MSEPKRILDENRAGLDIDLLRAGRAYAPRASAKRRVLVGLGMTGGAAASASAAKAAGTIAALKGLVGSKVGVGVLLVMSTVAGGAVIAHEARRKEDPGSAERGLAAVAATVTSVTPAPSGAVVPGPSDLDVDAGAPTDAPLPAPVAPSALRLDVPRPGPTPPASSSSETALPDELARLDRARVAQHAHDYPGALAELDSYAKAHPQGQLSMEAAVLRIEIVAASGDLARAKLLADRFLARHPQGLLSTRVRATEQRWAARMPDAGAPP